MDENQPVRSTTAGPGDDGGPDWSLERRLRVAWAKAAAGIAGLTPRRRWGVLALLLVLVAGAGLIWYAVRPDSRVLYAGLEAQDAREVAASLTAGGLPFDLSPDGATIRVPSESLDKARLLTTAKGGPKTGRMGFEMFDKPNWIGSEFDEKVNYQRALEGELEHTIDSMGAIESSRVALTMPHDSLFHRPAAGGQGLGGAEAEAPFAERRGGRLDPQPGGQRGNNLSADKVVLADADGHLMLGHRSATAEAEAHEAALAEKLIETLEPVAGAGNVRASVNVDYDTSTSEETDETYDPAAW